MEDDNITKRGIRFGLAIDIDPETVEDFMKAVEIFQEAIMKCREEKYDPITTSLAMIMVLSDLIGAGIISGLTPDLKFAMMHLLDAAIDDTVENFEGDDGFFDKLFKIGQEPIK